MKSVSAVVLGILRRVRTAEQVVAAATISLAHREQLDRLCSESRQLLELFERMHPDDRPRTRSDIPKESSWWFALSEATDVLRDAIDRVSALVARQEKGSPVRDLCAQTLRVLREHYNVLFHEARTWLDG
jgi:hypothetical protein